LKKAAKQIDGSGQEYVQYFSLDMTKESEVKVFDTFKLAEKEFGPIEFVFNNAGVCHPGMITEENALELARSNMELNYFGAVKTVHAAQRLMVPRGRGRICLIGSVCSFFNLPGMSAYGASKFALRAFADSIKNELAPKGITVHVFMPSTIDTPGLKIENKTKPKVTWEIEGSSTLISPEKAAKVCMKAIINGQYYITTEWMMDLLLISSAGSSSRTNSLKDIILSPLSTILNIVADYLTWFTCKSHLS